jgi:acetaldehyde dehydrogenase/alcohol dehydrogenase
MVCASEQAGILDREIRDAAIAEFQGLKAHQAADHEKRLLERYRFGVGAEEQGAGTAPAHS